MSTNNKSTNLTLRALKNTEFPEIYKNFILGNNNFLNDQKILSAALLLLNSSNADTKKLGYRIIVSYCNKTGDYKPLYEIAATLGLFPISKVIYNRNGIDSLFLEFNDLLMEGYKENGVQQSLGQKKLSEFFNKEMNTDVAVVAPTSYGKTDLILSMLKDCPGKNICVLTPSKSLLAQTKQRIMRAKIKGVRKIIIHPEMYSGKEENVLAVMTQERLLRFLTLDKEIVFDYVIVDESHNLLTGDNRARLLASVLILLKKRNPETIFKFLTPFLKDTENLKIKFVDFFLESHVVDEYIKTEKFYIYELKQGKGYLSLYDQFMDDFYHISEGQALDEIKFIEKHSSSRNIIYLNRPKHAEEFSTSLVKNRQEIGDDKINKACKAIEDYIDPDYDLIQCLKKGVAYHHGGMPESIKLYVESLFEDRSIKGLEYIVSTSTLLQGVNLPAERMFLLCCGQGQSYLPASSFKNLIGRVCRFKEIFTNNDAEKPLSLLEPEVYLVQSKYFHKNANMRTFLQDRVKVDKELKDDPQNILLLNTDKDKKPQEYQNACEFIENYEPGTIPSAQYDFNHIKTEVGKALFQNNVNEISVFEHEDSIQKKVDRLRRKNLNIKNEKDLFKNLDQLFFQHVTQGENFDNIARLQGEKARNFYEKFLKWHTEGSPYPKMIKSFLNHWSTLKGEDTVIYVGFKWGDTKREGYRELWTDIAQKTDTQKVNLAIVRIKEEQDFLENNIMKFIEILNDLGFLDKNFYHKIKYGTDDERVIKLVRNGLSLTLSKIVVNKYREFIDVQIDDMISFNKGLVDIMRANGENEVLINEVRYYME